MWSICKNVTLGVVGLLVIVFGSSVPALAASVSSASTSGAASGAGMQVSPLLSNLTIAAGTSSTVLVFVENVTHATETLQPVVNDFTAGSNETGVPELLLHGESDPQHGLKQFIAPLSNVTLTPGQEKEVQVEITIPSTAAAGGYYGAVRFVPIIAGQTVNVNLAASVGSLILVKVPGNIYEKMTIASFNVHKANNTDTIFTTNNGLTAVLRIQNEGNIQEQPFGKIEVVHGTKVLSTVFINNTTPPGNVLPNSIRQFSAPLKSIGTFGKYTIRGFFGYGSSGQLLSAQTTIYIVPLTDIIVLIILVLLIAFAIFAMPKLVHRYNQRVIKNARMRR